MATLKYYAQKDAYGFPIPGTLMAVPADSPLPDGVMEIPAADQIPTPVRKGQGSNLRYFVRHDKAGNIIPNSLVATLKKPSGMVYEIQIPGDGINDIPTGPTTPTGIASYVSRNNQMGDPNPCFMDTSNLNITIEDGKTFSSARYIYGDFASLGAYYTPADPNNMMAQPPSFGVAIVENGVRISKSFALKAVGVGENFNVMFNAPDAAAACPTYWTVDFYGNCADTPEERTYMVSNGTMPIINKWYKTFGNQGIMRIKAKLNASVPMVSSFDATTAYDTCQLASN
jgi:hypothetical protein